MTTPSESRLHALSLVSDSCSTYGRCSIMDPSPNPLHSWLPDAHCLGVADAYPPLWRCNYRQLLRCTHHPKNSTLLFHRLLWSRILTPSRAAGSSRLVAFTNPGSLCPGHIESSGANNNLQRGPQPDRASPFLPHSVLLRFEREIVKLVPSRNRGPPFPRSGNPVPYPTMGNDLTPFMNLLKA